MYNGDMFTITPMNQQIVLEAGKIYEGSITIINSTDATKDFNYRVSVAPYNVTDEDYTADLETMYGRSDIVNWIKIPKKTGTLEPGESTEVDFVVNVPESASSGGQYAVILVSSDEEATSNNSFAVSNIYEMGSIIYANVAGDIIHDVEVVENYIPGFSFVLPVTVSATLKNNGNTHETAKIALKISDVFSGQVVYPETGESGSLEEVIMPESMRYATRDINNISPIGIYNVEQSISYLGEVSTFRQTLIVCPAWFLILSILTISTLVTVIIRLIFKHKSKKRAVKAI